MGAFFVEGEDKMFYYILFAGLFGMCIASFVNVVIDRLPKGIGVVKGRSICPKCKHKLSFWDMIPVLSYFLLRGKCRYCHASIGIRDTINEVFGGLWAIFCLLHYGGGEIVLVFLLGMVLLCISYIDFDTMLIPNRILVIFGILVIALAEIEPLPSFKERIGGMLIVSGFMLVMNQLIECFGGGDIKLMFLVGYLLGGRACVFAFLIAVLTGGVYAILLLLLKKANRKSYIPFGPFLSLGILVVFLCYR
jgi:hypothetical protein